MEKFSEDLTKVLSATVQAETDAMEPITQKGYDELREELKEQMNRASQSKGQSEAAVTLLEAKLKKLD